MLNLALRVVVVWPTYLLGQTLHVIKYIVFFDSQLMLCLRAFLKLGVVITVVFLMRGKGGSLGVPYFLVR